MRKFITCYLSGRHDYSMGREPGTLFLWCVKCGHRSPGWTVEATRAIGSSTKDPVLAVTSSRPVGRLLPFTRTTAS